MSDIQVYGVTPKMEGVMKKKAEETSRKVQGATYEELAQEMDITPEQVATKEALLDMMNLLITEKLPLYAAAGERSDVVSADVLRTIDMLLDTPGLGVQEITFLKRYWTKIAKKESAPMKLGEEQSEKLKNVLMQKRNMQ